MTGSKSGKKNGKAVYCYPVYLSYMQSTSCKMPGLMNHKLKPRMLEKYHNLRYADDTTLRAESEEELKRLLMKVKRKVKKLA